MLIKVISAVLVGAWIIVGTDSAADALAVHRDGKQLELGVANVGDAIHGHLSGTLPPGAAVSSFAIRHTGPKRDVLRVNIRIWEGQPGAAGSHVAFTIDEGHAVPSRDPQSPIRKSVEVPVEVSDPWLEVEVQSMSNPGLGLIIGFFEMEI